MLVSTRRAGASLALAAACLFAAGCGSNDAPDSSSDSKRTASPKSSHKPKDWAEPKKSTDLPHGKHTVNGDPVDFPRTTKGAVAMLKEAAEVRVEKDHYFTDVQLRLLHRYQVEAEQTPENAKKIKTKSEEKDAKLRRKAGVKKGEPLPREVSLRSDVVGYKIVSASPDSVRAWLLTRQAEKDKHHSKAIVSFERTLTVARWEKDDWKVSIGDTIHAMQEQTDKDRPEATAPGKPGFNKADWTAIRGAV
ncbi:hypothetical protein [Streptomyces sp. 891-h]|uniref:hypothetical protein n=1 Tax=Streptomyces sp. 891-h TaxID=2720714 RepID=UPI001FAAFF17|nr:hypothetical protein [Streptomyces sp. 891-h]UNZ21356.1 hypothetical protein HC362_34200 [Streptomyces sp. 891-h]